MKKCAQCGRSVGTTYRCDKCGISGCSRCVGVSGSTCRYCGRGHMREVR